MVQLAVDHLNPPLKDLESRIKLCEIVCLFFALKPHGFILAYYEKGPCLNSHKKDRK